MDYEQKYEAALERARMILCNIPEGESCKDIETIFPELAESEDERVRKALIRHFNEKRNCVGEMWAGFKCDDVIAYLEKQKDLFESGRGLYYYDGEKTTYCGYPATEDNPYDFAMNQQKEQKPAEWSDTNELVFKDICKHLKEEGFGGWVVLLEALKNGEFSNPTIDNNTVNVTMIADPKTGERVPFVSYKDQEWSEEDEEMVRDIILVVSESKNCFDEEMISWLKSLRPQPHTVSIKDTIKFGNLEYERGVEDGIQSEKSRQWRPTEEQMEALKYALGDGGTYDRKTLEALYEQLKKL